MAESGKEIIEKRSSVELRFFNKISLRMSGSALIQDGKLVGTVTYVLINNPTTGRGIFIENMLAQMGTWQDKCKIE